MPSTKTWIFVTLVLLSIQSLLAVNLGRRIAAVEVELFGKSKDVVISLPRSR
jgi:hypothetical protein